MDILLFVAVAAYWLGRWVGKVKQQEKEGPFHFYDELKDRYGTLK